VCASAASAGFEVAVRPLPHRDGVPPAGNWIGGDSFWLADGLDPDLADGALAFLQFLHAPENVAAWHRAGGSIPTTQAAVELLTRQGWYDEHPEHRAALAQVALTDRTPASCSPIIPGWRGVQPALERAMDDVLQKAAIPEQRFTDASLEAQRALEDYRTECLAGGPRGTGWLQAGT
jgi:sn-glycerol 3-phosphate transport system substrate-binding protein